MFWYLLIVCCLCISECHVEECSGRETGRDRQSQGGEGAGDGGYEPDRPTSLSYRIDIATIMSGFMFIFANRGWKSIH